MTVSVDFADAHRCHGGAELLFMSERPGNADHLYGPNAESGPKAVMERLEVPVAPTGLPPTELG